LAKAHKLKSIAFPSISTGAYRFPVSQAASIALKTVKLFIDKNPNVLDKAIFVLFSKEDFKIYNDLHSVIYRS